MDREQYYYQLKNGLCGKIIRNIEVHEGSFFHKPYIELVVEDPKTGKRSLTTLISP
jgi:hypothetical protein